MRLLSLFALLFLFGCGDQRDPRMLQQPVAQIPNVYPFMIPEEPHMNDWQYHATEYCYKGVVYVVFNPGYNSSVASVRFNPDSTVARCP